MNLIFFKWNNYKIFCFFTLLIFLFNAFLISSIPLSLTEQCLNILLTIGIFEYFRNRKIEVKKRIKFASILPSAIIFLYTLIRSFWSFSLEDQFIYFVLLLLLSSLMMVSFSFKNLLSNLKPILIAAIYPFQKFIFIPLSIVITPLSTAITWFVLNVLGFNVYTRGQEIFIGNGGVDVTFGCSGSEQIIFTTTSMIVLNSLIPFKKNRIFIMQLLISFVITFLTNILRLCILTIFVDTLNSGQFSIFDFFHGPRGSLIFSFISTALCCEVYKRLYHLEQFKF